MFDPSRFYSAVEVWHLSHAPRELVYADLASGRLKSIARGSRYLIPGACAAAWIEELST